MQIKYIYGNHVFNFENLKIHLFDVSEKKDWAMSYSNYIYDSLCNRTRQYAYRSIKDLIFIRYDYHAGKISYKHICKFCLKKLPSETLDRIKQEFIVAKLKGTK